MKRKILAVCFLVVICAQFFQPTKNLGPLHNPSDIHQVISTPPAILAILKQSCYDCHSNRTDYPWYANLTPVNWWLAAHINQGKSELNFSIFGSYSAWRQMNSLEAIAETVKADKMPLKPYLSMHTEARLTQPQKLQLFDWAISASNKITAQN